MFKMFITRSTPPFIIPCTPIAVAGFFELTIASSHYFRVAYGWHPSHRMEVVHILGGIS